MIGIFDWLFGRPEPVVYDHSYNTSGSYNTSPPREQANAVRWSTSERGNPMLEFSNGKQLVVFPQDDDIYDKALDQRVPKRFWKFVHSRIDQDEDRMEPHFSGSYATMEEAQHEALAYVGLTQSRYVSRQQAREDAIQEGVRREAPGRLAKDIEELGRIQRSSAMARRTFEQLLKLRGRAYKLTYTNSYLDFDESLWPQLDKLREDATQLVDAINTRIEEAIPLIKTSEPRQ